MTIKKEQTKLTKEVKKKTKEEIKNLPQKKRKGNPVTCQGYDIDWDNLF